jgi:guanine deaminase
MENEDLRFLRMAIELAREGMDAGAGGPFGCVIVRDGEVVGKAFNRVTSTNDPTAHAEVAAIRDACSRTGHFELEGCVLYASCEPCPMCLGAIYWSRLRRVVYASTHADAADAGFDDAFIYREIDRPPPDRSIPMQQALGDEGRTVFESWKAKPDKTLY